MLLESRKVRLQKITPQIIAYLRCSEDHSVLELVIENIGEGVAQRVDAKLAVDYKQFGVESCSLSNQGVFKNGFNNFPPHYRLRYLLNAFSKIDFNNTDNKLQVELTYKRIDGEVYKETFDLIFDQVLGQMYSNPPETYIGKIPYQLNEVNKSLKKVADHISKKE